MARLLSLRQRAESAHRLDHHSICFNSDTHHNVVLGNGGGWEDPPDGCRGTRRESACFLLSRSLAGAVAAAGHFGFAAARIHTADGQDHPSGSTRDDGNTTTAAQDGRQGALSAASPRRHVRPITLPTDIHVAVAVFCRWDSAHEKAFICLGKCATDSLSVRGAPYACVSLRFGDRLATACDYTVKLIDGCPCNCTNLHHHVGLRDCSHKEQKKSNWNSLASPRV